MPYASDTTSFASRWLPVPLLLQAIAHETGRPTSPGCNCSSIATIPWFCQPSSRPSHLHSLTVNVWMSCDQLVLTSAFSAISNGIPGTYRLIFAASDSFGDTPVEPAILQLRITPCPKGYATASTGDACIPCVTGYFSFNPLANECSTCVPNAICPGGATVRPAKGFFHSAPQSVQMHR